MTEPFYTVLRVLHGGGGWLAFVVAPLALLTIKGSRRHILAGQCTVAILWARRRFGGPSMVQGPTATALTGAA